MVTGRAVFSWYGLGVEACDGGRTESAPLWSLTVMSMFTCHCEVAPAQPVGGGTETEQVSRQRGENILEAGTACAKALRFESLLLKRLCRVPYMQNARQLPPVPSWTVYRGVSSGWKTRALVASALLGSRS